MQTRVIAGSIPPVNNQAGGSSVVATVNTTTITQNQVDALQVLLQKQLQGQAVDDDVIIEQLVNMALLAEAAEKERIDSRSDVIEGLAFQRLNLLSILMQQELLQRSQPNEEQIEAAYESIPSEEYRVDYIVVKSEATANDVIKK